MKRGQRLLRGSLRAGAGGLLVVVVMAAALWGTLALWFALPAEAGARLIVAVLFAGLGIGGLVMALRRRRMFLALLPFTIALMVLLLWWSTIEPSNDRAWQPDVARLPSAEIDGDFVTIAHTMLSFGFAGEPVTISIETRKERGEEYSALAGFFRRYELYYVVGDERDLIGLRTTYRAPPEDVYLYRVQAPPENIRRLFLEYFAKIKQLRERPEFYNTAITNCTTNIVTHVRAFREDVPLDWRMLLSGYFPELVYARGGLDQSLPFEALRRRSLINERARAAETAPDFSRRIRAGLPGISTIE
jgi:Domain of unknown function (DUF4105)